MNRAARRLATTFAAGVATFAGWAGAEPAPIDDADFVYVEMLTDKGDIVIELNRERAPIGVDNFLRYVDDGFYANTVFHRVIREFVIQGGGFTAEVTGGEVMLTQKQTRDPIKNEWKNGLKNTRGSLSWARTPIADSATSQFFINVKDNDALDVARGDPSGGPAAAYAVFGRVVEGMEIVDIIRDVPTTVGTSDGGARLGDTPTEPVAIVSVTRLEGDERARLLAEHREDRDRITLAARADAVRLAESEREQAERAAERERLMLAEAKGFVETQGGDVASIVTTDSGLMYIDAVVGEGASPASSSQRVTVHYTGWLTNGSKFDSSVDRGQPATFGLNRVIPGWTEGVGSMNVGGTRWLIIPADLAYGERGRPSIPGGAMLVFKVELLDLAD